MKIEMLPSFLASLAYLVIEKKPLVFNLDKNIVSVHELTTYCNFIVFYSNNLLGIDDILYCNKFCIDGYEDEQKIEIYYKKQGYEQLKTAFLSICNNFYQDEYDYNTFNQPNSIKLIDNFYCSINSEYSLKNYKVFGNKHLLAIIILYSLELIEIKKISVEIDHEEHYEHPCEFMYENLETDSTDAIPDAFMCSYILDINAFDKIMKRNKAQDDKESKEHNFKGGQIKLFDLIKENVKCRDNVITYNDIIEAYNSKPAKNIKRRNVNISNKISDFNSVCKNKYGISFLTCKKGAEQYEMSPAIRHILRHELN
ncbi:MAG: hypothetical protein R3Y28_06040 [Candidatus Gastranaerophilales bacterium]